MKAKFVKAAAFALCGALSLPGASALAQEAKTLDELLGRHTRGDVDEVAAGGGPDDPEEDCADDGEFRLETLLHTDHGVPRQRERREELIGGLTELLPLAEGEEERECTGAEAEPQVSGVGDRARYLVEEHVARDAATDSAEHGHDEDPDNREVLALVVIWALGQQPTIERVDRRSKEIDNRE